MAASQIKQLSAPILTFVEETHQYFLDDYAAEKHGPDCLTCEEIPGTTSVINYGKDTSRIPRWTGLLGTLVHRACEYDTMGDLDESTLVAQEIDGRVCDPWPYLRAWRRYSKGFHPYAVELPVWGEIDGMRYAGTIDVVWAIDRHGLFAIDDIKTSRQARPKEHGPQVQAYKHAFVQRLGGQVRGAGCVYLRADETHDPVKYNEREHLDTFRRALARYYEETRNG